MNIIYTDQTILHLIRHLSVLSDDARKKLEDNDDTSFEELLATTGSKFHKKIDNPFVLAEWCIDLIKTHFPSEDELNWKQGEDKQYVDLAITVSSSEKQLIGIENDSPLGTSSVINITPDLLNKVSTEIRGKGEDGDQIEIKVIEGIEPKPTDNLVLSIGKSNGKMTLLSTYTGILSPPFPGRFKQSEEDEKESQEFWSNHAFLK